MDDNTSIPEPAAALSAAADSQPDQQSPDRTVTSGRRPGTPAIERKRQQRERDRAALLYERDDWQLFLDPATLPQKAGCQPSRLREIVLKEVVDNALDCGAGVTLQQVEDVWIIADDGPGLDPSDVVRLFAVNRPLASSKYLRIAPAWHARERPQSWSWEPLPRPKVRW